MHCFFFHLSPIMRAPHHRALTGEVPQSDDESACGKSLPTAIVRNYFTPVAAVARRDQFGSPIERPRDLILCAKHEGLWRACSANESLLRLLERL